MNVGSLSSVAAYSSAQATTEAKQDAGLKTFKQAIDMQADLALQLIQSIDPAQSSGSVGNIGQNVSVRV
ncbi:YjfB family protein [Saccharospirillum impatiens]|uniref:YjfB family protein n=1 Tax=Saccharospirillum impatiens TaxID=169438 RepID=UPI000490C95F|nr:YjfB family protein [Saccharospirillum impatiens]